MGIPDGEDGEPIAEDGEATEDAKALFNQMYNCFEGAEDGEVADDGEVAEDGEVDTETA